MNVPNATAWALTHPGEPVPELLTRTGPDYGNLPEYVQPWAAVFVKSVIRRDVALWRRTVDEWIERGADLDTARKARALHEGRGLSVKGPQSYTWAIIEVLRGREPRGLSVIERRMAEIDNGD